MHYRLAPLLVGFFSLVPVASLSAQELLIENATVISPEAAEPLRNRYVLVRNGRIATVSQRSPRTSSAAVRIDGRGKFLTPGLMDSHVHVSDAPGLPRPLPDALAPLLEAFTRQQPRSYLYFGVTQLLDPSNLPEAIDAFQAQPQRPDLFRCGAAPVLNGYPSVFVPPELRYHYFPDYIVEPANRDPLPDGANAQEHTPEAVVARIAASGAKCVKIFVEDGFGPASNWPVLSAATISKVRDAARRHGLVLMAHANALDMQRIALEGKVDVVAHGLWNWTRVEDDGAVPPPIAEHLRRVHDAQLGWQPTLRVMAGTQELFLKDTLDDPVYRKVVPTALLAWYRTAAGKWFREVLRKESGGGSDDDLARGHSRVQERGMRATRYLHELGHPLLLASDTPSAPTYGNQPGYDTYREMQLLTRAGVPLKAIFAAATINNARQFRLDKDYGTVEAGKIANLLLLDANPLESIEAWTRIDKIVLHGKVFGREEFAADVTP